MIDLKIIEEEANKEEGWVNRETCYEKMLEDDDCIVVIQKSKNDRPRRIMYAIHYKNPKPLPSDTSTLVIKELKL